MTDIEVKRKELETAKRIREAPFPSLDDFALALIQGGYMPVDGDIEMKLYDNAERLKKESDLRRGI